MISVRLPWWPSYAKVGDDGEGVTRFVADRQRTSDPVENAYYMHS